ncbi:MAG: MFS transporter [Sphingomonadales bacterium]
MRWYYGWNVLATAIVFQALLVGIVFYGFTVWGTPWIQEFHTGAEMVMRANAGATLATGALMLYAGRLMDRYSMRWIIICGTLLLAAGMVLVAFATAMWQIIALYTTLIACGYAFSTTLAGQVLAARWFPRRVGFAVGMSLLGSSLGGIVMPPLLAFLLERYGWRDANLMLAALVVVVVVPMVWFVVRMPREGETGVTAPDMSASGAAATGGEEPWGFFEVLREPTFWIIGLACLGTTLASYSFLTSIGPYSHDLGIDPQRMSLLIPILAITGIAGRLVLGWMVDQVDPRIPYWIATAIMWGTLLLTLGTPSYGTLMLISGLIGLGAGGLLPVCCVMVGQKFGARSFSRVMGMATPFFSVSAAAGPWISARIRDSLGSYTEAFHFRVAGLDLSVTAFGIYLWILPLAAILMYFLHKSAMTRRSPVVVQREAAA